MHRVHYCQQCDEKEIKIVVIQKKGGGYNMATTKKTTTKKGNGGAGGRPKTITESVIRKLEEGFSKGLNVSECCLWANVPKSTYYDFLSANPEYSERFEALKSNVRMIAKMNLYDKIQDGDDYNSRWYLERTSDEFNPKQKQELTGKDGAPIEVTSAVQIYLPDNKREENENK